MQDTQPPEDAAGSEKPAKDTLRQIANIQLFAYYYIGLLYEDWITMLSRAEASERSADI